MLFDNDRGNGALLSTAGDLIVWDNWCTLHHRNPFDDSQSRIMHRTQIKGVKPN
jgi:taurine dioxygenase